MFDKGKTPGGPPGVFFLLGILPTIGGQKNITFPVFPKRNFDISVACATVFC